MIILKLKAGLGNQMFQYAYAKALALKSDTELRIDLSWFDNQPARDTFRYFGLNHFNIRADVYNSDNGGPRQSKSSVLLNKVVSKIMRLFFNYSDYVYYPEKIRSIRKSKIKFVEGYWNTEKYFINIEKTLREEFTLVEPLGKEAEQAKAEILEAENHQETPVLILVRRGDYVSNPFTKNFHGAMETDYYASAISKMHEQIKERYGSEDKMHFFVTSDDIEWVKLNLTSDVFKNKPVSYITREGIKDYEELHLMSLCHHFIIANSTFSWWAAWLSESAKKLGQEKIVIGPKRWVADPSVDTKDVMPENWIRI